MVPPHHSLHRNTPVLIVLKADQTTGKLTSGLIADVLTRGNHPRGVKVRLQDGRIGRVQALRSSSDSLNRALLPTEEVRAFGEKGKGKGGVSGDCCDREEGSAVQSTTSLGDYMKPAKSRVREAASSSVTTAQEQLERAFPSLDSALIAAILVDYPSVHDAQGVLEA
ncbi:MAG: hypothetical protein Q9193_003039, partial [Seirophora villosa]